MGGNSNVFSFSPFIILIFFQINDVQSLLCKYGYDINIGKSKLQLAPQSYICATLQPPGCLTFGFTGKLQRTDTGWEEASGIIYHCDLSSSCGRYCSRPNSIARLLNMDVHDIVDEEIRSCNETCCFEHNCNSSSAGRCMASMTAILLSVVLYFITTLIP